MIPAYFYNTKLSPAKRYEFGFYKIIRVFPILNGRHSWKYKCSILFFAVILLLLTQCKCNRSNNTVDRTEIMETDTSQQEALIIPTPDEMLAEILSQKVIIDPQLVNPLSNAEKYLNTKFQALNLGVYIADFNYLNLYNNKTNALEYFNIMKDMAQKININVNFNEHLFYSVQNNLANNDSLKGIFKEIFLDMSRILEKSNRQNIYALISLGAFAEILYLSAMSVTNFSEYESIVNRIFDQKYVFKNIYEYSSKFKNDNDIGSILIQLDNIRLVMENAENKSVDTSNVRKEQDQPTRRGNVIIKTDEATFINLKKMISNTRQNIINIFNY